MTRPDLMPAEMRTQVECQGKEQFTPEMAKRVADRMRGSRDGGRRVQAYKCSVCRCWHVGGVPAMLKGHRGLK